MTAATVLLRQAHPKFVEAEAPTSQVFMPNSDDEGSMSAYDGDQISAADSHAHYTQVLHKQSHSVWGLSCAELEGEGVPGSPDPLEDFPSHSKIDFTGKTDKQSRRIAKKLKTLALARGCQYLPA
jgi:hypothetical protein